MVTKKEFDSIELAERKICWTNNSTGTIYTALKDNASIFILYEHGNYQSLSFKKGQYFEINEDFIIFDENTVKDITP